MKRVTNDVTGTMVYWDTCSIEDRRPLDDVLDRLGLSQCQPPRKNPASIARDVLKSIAERGEIVRQLDRRQGYALVREDQGSQWNEYQCLASITVAGDTVKFHGSEAIEARLGGKTLREAFVEQERPLSAEGVGACLRRIVATLDGVSLRKTGGLYWLNETEADRFGEVVEVVERTAPGTLVVDHRVEARSPKAIESIKRGLLQEVEAADAIFRTACESGRTLREVTFQGALKQAEDLEAKAKRYEAVLAASLADVSKVCQQMRDRVTETRLARAAAARSTDASKPAVAAPGGRARVRARDL